VDVTSLGFRTDLHVLRLGGSEITDRGDYLIVRTPADPSYWWGNFMLLGGPVEPGSVPTLLKRYDDELPGAEHVAWGIDSVDGSVGAEDELAGAGFGIERNTVLTATSLVPPAGATAAELRPFSGDDDWAQGLGLRTACSDLTSGAYTTGFLIARAAQERALCSTGHAAWYGAFAGGVLQAALGLVTDGEIARYQTVETRPDARRQGLASALIHRAGATALAAGVKTLVIVADPDYHAIELYRRLGFTDRETQVQLTRRPPGVE
jgi:ribosomal protein S18 acetylase RimI-like enzyme